MHGVESLTMLAAQFVDAELATEATAHGETAHVCATTLPVTSHVVVAALMV